MTVNTCSTSEAEVFQPYGGVGVLGVLNDVHRCTKTHREWHLPDPLRERLWATSVRAQTALSILDPKVSDMVVRVTITIVWQILAC
jgi:hypothetical protein